MKKTFLVLCVCLVLSVLAYSQDAASQGEEKKVIRGAQVMKLLHHDVSAPFKDLPNIVNFSTVKKVHPIRNVPLPPGAADEANASKDPNIQKFLGALAIPSASGNFEGIGEATSPSCNCAPPDTNGAVGPNHFVQTVNTTLGVYSKTGVMAAGFPKTIQSLWSGFAGQCANTNDGDPVVAYDQFADRWVISQFSVTGSNRECIAVSTTNNPTGSYSRYEYQYTGFNDYPKIAVWPDGYYITYNMFSGESGAKVCAFDRAKMLTGAAAGTQCFNTPSYSLLAATVDGPAPPAGAPEYVVNFGTNSLRLWKFKVDWANSANSTFTGPTTINANSFAAACGGGSCISQSGTTNKLDSLADRLMNRFAYRNFGTHESFVVNHSVFVTSSGRGKNKVEIDGVRWYELRNTPASANGNPSMFQQGTYAPNDGLSRWMGSVAMDKQGNIGLGFSASGASAFPSIRYTGRLAADPAGQMSQGEAVITSGTGSQTGNLHRWGDYSSIMADPVDGCTFWYTTEYLTTNGSFNWHTHVGSFKVSSGCN
jgi:hypothetical protein